MIINTLKTYRQKRDFRATSEPKGKKGSSKHRLHFVVQWHHASHLHFDFRLEWNGVLLSWAVPKGPSLSPQDKRLAIQVEDHPLDYQNFEGTIPQGEYGGGTVMIWDQGEWTPETESVTAALKKGILKFSLSGQRLKGRWSLIQLKKSENSWLLRKEQDQHAKRTASIGRFKRSIISGRTMKEIASPSTQAKNPFHLFSPQLCKLETNVPTGSNWLYEIKYDGYRIFAIIEHGKVILQSRNRQDYTKRFPRIAADLSLLAQDRAMILDGEIVVFDAEGKSDFQSLQAYFKNPHQITPTYKLFDLLALDGQDLRQEPLIKRKKLLKELLQDASSHLSYCEHILEGGPALYQEATKAGLEGIIAKRRDSTYEGLRSSDWQKIKSRKSQEFVVGGYIIDHQQERNIRALLLGIYQGDKFQYVGKVGSGLNKQNVTILQQYHRTRKRSPFINPPQTKGNVVYLHPQLLAEVEYAEWTEENLLRQPSFKGWRDDKSPRSVRRETLTTIPIKFTSSERVIYPREKITKGDVRDYYQKVASRMLPYIEGRLLSVIRCPENITQELFFKKHPTTTSKAIHPQPIANQDHEKQTYFYLDSVEGILTEVQNGTVEFHTWASAKPHFNKPNVVIFDLDPDEEVSLEQIRQGVRDLHMVLQTLHLKAFLKTSGGKGYHIVVPLSEKATWNQLRAFAKTVAQYLANRWPERYTANMRKNKRSKRIFIDWVRNGKGATCVAPYSLRARSGAPVSMPITWKELSRIAPDGINLSKALKRLSKEDPWRDFYQTKQALPSLRSIKK